MAPVESDITAADGTRIRLWEVSPDDATEAVLFVHGATYPTRAVFAPPIEADGEETYSWLRAAAQRGRAAFAVDLRGYGQSDRPTPVDGPSGVDVPARATDVVADVEAALKSICDRFDRVHLVGYSWGSIVCGVYVTTVNDDVASLTQVAPVYRPPADVAARFVDVEPLEPFRRITRDDVRERWNDQIPDGTNPSRWRSGEPESDPVLEAVWQGLASSQYRLESADVPTVEVPNGTFQDLRASTEDDPAYRADEISVPTLVVRGSLDPTAARSDALALYDELDSTACREYAEIGGGTHFLALERRRTALYDAVDSYQNRVESDR
ncbi:alpha/beta hydrolase [Natrinema caseinilyticum]|uniref:alpha/beta hydrolase n=1 Tax=Natrinema caseinilyticum TaxID=2961570 RepID=UPI0020C503D5|nr:alpha/beta hydrolase [Natrinema caseinilyticum]